MAGNHRSGRKRLPVELHVTRGSYRNDRHGPLPAAASDSDPVDETAAIEMVYSPNDGDVAARDLYDHLYPLLASVVAPSDTPALTMLCELWSLYQQTLAAAKAEPTSKAVRSALLSYFGAFDRLASR